MNEVDNVLLPDDYSLDILLFNLLKEKEEKLFNVENITYKDVIELLMQQDKAKSIDEKDCENEETSMGEEAELVEKNLDSEERFNVNDPDLLNLSTSDSDEVVGVGNNSHDGCPKTAVKTIKTEKDSEVEEDAESNVKIQTPMPATLPREVKVEDDRTPG